MSPRCVLVVRVWSCLICLSEESLSTSSYLKSDVIGSCLMVTVDLFAEDAIRMV